MANILTDRGYLTKESQFGYASSAQVYEGIIPVTITTIRFLKFLLEMFPEFNYEPIFVEEQRSEIHQRL
jgi:hypothetical protein